MKRPEKAASCLKGVVRVKLITLVTIVAVILGVNAQGAFGKPYLDQIHHYQKETWKWQGLMQVRKHPTANTAKKNESSTYRRWVRDLWLRRAYRAWRQAQNPPHKTGFLCIFSHEKGADRWQTNTGNGYYGGLQMDLGFQRTYGWELLRKKGTANNWTWLEQIWVAERAHRSRGYYPWPNTARYCGLI